MKKLKILSITIIVLVIAAGILGTISWETGMFKNIAFSYLAKKFQREISADSLRIAFLKQIEISGLKVSDKYPGGHKQGFAVSAQKIKVDYDLRKLFSGGLLARCEAEDVRILREKLGFLKPLFEFLLVPYSGGSLRFENVEADIYLENKTFIPKNLKAVGRNIKVFGDGFVNSDGVIDYELKFLMAPKKTSGSKVFEIFKGLITGEEEAGWASLSFRIKGKADEFIILPSRN